MRDLYLLRVRPQMIVDPASEDRCFHGDCPWLRKSFYPAVQFASGSSDLAFLVNLAARILDAKADRLDVSDEETNGDPIKTYKLSRKTILNIVGT